MLLDLWRVSRRPLGNDDMDEMTRLLIDALLPGAVYRAEPRVHPYTLDGRQIDVHAGGEWVEVWECGLAHPEVLARAGLAGWQGLALGLGLDRFVMLRKGIPDIRLLRSTDRRVVNQMLDLAPYRPVSTMPRCRGICPSRSTSPTLSRISATGSATRYARTPTRSRRSRCAVTRDRSCRGGLDES